MYACERMYIFCFFEMAWDDLKGIILQRIERCYATVFGECTICSYFLDSPATCVLLLNRMVIPPLRRFHQMCDDDSSRLALPCLALPCLALLF